MEWKVREATFARVLEALRTGAPLDAIPNLAIKGRDGALTFTPLETESNELAENVIDYSRFRSGALGEFLRIRTAKSCPFSCAFWAFPRRAEVPAGACRNKRIPGTSKDWNQQVRQGPTTPGRG